VADVILSSTLALITLSHTHAVPLFFEPTDLTYCFPNLTKLLAVLATLPEDREEAGIDCCRVHGLPVRDVHAGHPQQHKVPDRCSIAGLAAIYERAGRMPGVQEYVRHGAPPPRLGADRQYGPKEV